MGSLSQLHPIPLGLAVAPPAGPCQRPSGGGGESVQGLAGMRGGSWQQPPLPCCLSLAWMEGASSSPPPCISQVGVVHTKSPQSQGDFPQDRGGGVRLEGSEASSPGGSALS